MKTYSALFFSILLFALTSCGANKAQEAAERFCSCSSELAKAKAQLDAGTLDQASFDKVKKEHENCMGEENPLETLKDDPQALMEFKAQFLTELEKQCPDVARNMGYGE